MKLRLCCVLLASLCACKTSGPAPRSSAMTSAGDASATDPIDRPLHEGPSIAARTHGVPHSSNIDMVVLSREATMAMSRDAIGGVRLWAALDGTAEPALVPIRGARGLSLAKTEDGSTLAVIDGIGALHILHANADGSMRELYMSSPHTPLRKAAVMKGGKRVLALGQDHSLSLLDLTGKRLSSIQTRRFRPEDFRLAKGDTQVMTFSSENAKGSVTLTMRKVAVDVGAGTLLLDPAETEIEGVLSLEDKRFGLSPDGSKLAFLGFPGSDASADAKAAEKPPSASGPPVAGRRITAALPLPSPPGSAGAQTATVIVQDVASGSQSSIELNLPAHELTSLGFVSSDTLVVSSRPSGGSWRVSLGSEITSSALPSAIAQDTQRSAHDFAGGVHLAADGTWLFVQDVKRASHHYLGYSAFDPQHASITPDSTRVAWTTGQMIFVESLEDESSSVRITAPPTEAYFRAAFIDDDHLVAIDYSGGLHLIDWRKGKELATIDTGGGVREFEVDQSRKLIRGVRQTGGSWLCELGEDGFKGPYLIQDQGFRSGFLGGDDALWTLDSQVRYHSYTLAQLRAGLSAKQLQAASPAMTGPAPLAIDARGQRYFVMAQSNTAIVTVKDSNDKEVSTMEIPWMPLQFHVSPDGSKLAMVSSSGAIIDVFDQSTGASLWSMSAVQGIRHVAWSMDSQSLAVASQQGAVVFKAESAQQVRLGCGPWFERRKTPPTSTMSFSLVQNLCER